MAVVLSPETEKLIEQRRAELGDMSADELVRSAVESYGGVRGEDFEDLDQATQDAIEEALAQSERGEGRPLDEFRKELEARCTRTD